ncbi:MAG: hypothetical protein CSA26_06090 [Desulfobacterales bacterium]|nr:MAG: hypothetical protein CSA26_06090 [Desulfobacterales bacterium]
MQTNKNTLRDILDQSITCQNGTLRIDWGQKKGFIHFRNGTIVAAEVGSLSGNGALLDIARWQGVTVHEVQGDPTIKKNVTLSPKEIEDIFRDFSITTIPSSDYDDQKQLEEAICAIHQFRYREAAARLVEILKYNRFHYLAWLWYSRLLGKKDSIEKALTEARKWGDHAPDVWLEVKKNKIGFSGIKSQEMKRCLYCWTPLNKTDRDCCYCLAPQLIYHGEGLSSPKKSELKRAINNYLLAIKTPPGNGRIGYTLAVAFHALKMDEKAVKYIRYAVATAPTKISYQRAQTFLEELLQKKDKPSGPALTKPDSRRSEKEIKPVSSTADTGSAILVVEDSPTARKVIKMVLDREGFGVVEAETGQQALELAESARPALILLDVMLPDMTGYDILPRLREHQHLADIPVVMLTGKKGSEDRLKGMLAGSSEYLTKPFDPLKLTNVIKKYL